MKNNTTEDIDLKIERALQEWMDALDAVEDPIFMHDREFRILRCNLAYQKCAGLPFKQIIGRPYYEIFPKSDTPLHSCRLAMDSHAAEEEEIAVGDTLFRSRAYAIKDEAGVYRHSVHILEEITERRRMEEALKSSERQYRRLFEAAKDAILILDAETGAITDANPFLINLIDYTLEELTGKQLWEIGLFSDIEESKAALRKLQSERYIRYDDMPLQTREGKNIDVEFVSNLYEVGSRNVIQCNIRDITERKDAEKALRASYDLLRSIVENAPVRVFWKDLELRYLGCNSAFARDAGFSAPEELTGRDDFQMGWRKHAELYRADDRAVIDSGIPKIGYEEPQTTPDGAQIWLRTSKVPLQDGDGSIIGILGVYEDITERKETALQLQQERDFNEHLVETAQVIILILDPQGKIVRFNRYMEELTGYTLEEVKGADWFGIFIPEAKREMTQKLFLGAIDDIQTRGNIDTLLTKDGRTLQIEWYDKTLKSADGTTMGLLAVGMDVTGRREAEEQLKLFRTLLDRSGDAIEVIEPATLRLLDVNETECRTLGYSRDELLAMSVYDIDPEFTPERAEAAETRMWKEESISFEGVHRRKDCSTFPVEIKAALIALDRDYILSIARDITERKQAEAALRASEERYKRITEGLTDYQYTVRIENGYATETSQSPACISVTGYTSEEFSANPSLWLEMVVPEDRESVMQRVRRILAGRDVPPMELRIVRKDGEIRWVSETTILFRDDAGTLRSYDGVIKDITEKKQAEEALRRANRALKTLSAGNLALVRAQSEEALLQDVTDVIVEIGGYSLAVVDYADNEPRKSITPMAWSGLEATHHWARHFSWSDTGENQMPASAAIRSGATQVCRDIAETSEFTLWREAALARGYRSSIAIPLFDGGRTFGALNIYSAEAESFDKEEVTLLEEMGYDLAYGILTLRTRAEHEEHARLLHQSLEQSIQTIAATVEARDPYTAGHQRRVAELATAIAREMELDDEQIQGIHLAAVIHDLGKIHVPAEILAKPGKLSEIEYMLIQTHPRDGYEILKNVAFPWPIAEIILQHHERLDGSGYPQGLKGEQIRLEAKILAVADVVEAIASHRPYRPALGIEPALEEISRMRGTHFDPQVVDACIVLFREKHYVIPY